jgi:hypothetical protein
LHTTLFGAVIDFCSVGHIAAITYVAVSTPEPVGQFYPALMSVAVILSPRPTVAGLAIALLPTFLLEAPVMSRSLGVVDVGAEPEGAAIFIAYPKDLRSSEKLRTLTPWLRNAFGNPPYWDANLAV